MKKHTALKQNIKKRFLILLEVWRQGVPHTRTGSSGAARGGEARPPRNWVHRKIPGCALELNTQNCAWFGSQISLITAMSFREAMPPPNHPPGALPLDPAGGPPFPRPPVPPPHLQILAVPLTGSRETSVAETVVCAWNDRTGPGLPPTQGLPPNRSYIISR